MTRFSGSRGARALVTIAMLLGIGALSALLAVPAKAGTIFATPADNLRTVLVAPYTSGSGTVTLAAGYGTTIAAKLSSCGFPAVSSSAPLRFTLVAAAAQTSSGQITNTARQAIYLATTLTGDVLSGVTVEAGSTDQNFAIGDTWTVNITARSLYNVQGAVNTLEANKNLFTGQVQVQAAPTLTDLTIWKDNTGTPVAALNNAGSVGVGTVQLGIGTASPARPLHISVADIGAGGYILMENTDTTHNNNGSVVKYATTTTGVGAATLQDYVTTTAKILTHDQPTLASTYQISTKNGAGAFNTFVFDQLGNLAIGGTFKGALQDKAGQVFNAKSYGCVGDGVTDDAANLRLAISAASAAGGIVYFPSGTYLIKSQITVPANCTFQGSGPGSIVQGNGAFEVLFSVGSVTNVEFTNLVLNGGASVGIYVSSSSYVRVRNCDINNFTRVRDTVYTSGILVNAGTHVLIADNRMVGNGYGGGAGAATNGSIVFQDNATTDSTDVIVSRNQITNAGLYGICGFDVSDCKFLANTINQGNVGNVDNNNGYGILIYDAQHALPGRNFVNRNVISHNNVSNCYGTGIYCVVGIDNTIDHNTVRNVALTMDTVSLRPGGIVVNESVNTVIDANQVDTVGAAQANTVAGIASLIGTNDSVINNKIANVISSAGTPKADGIDIGGTGEVVTLTVGGRIAGNTIKNVSQYGINLDAAAAKVDLVVESNFVQTCGQVGVFINNVQNSQFNHNTVRDWGAGAQGYLLASSTTNNSFTGNVAETSTGNTGRAFQVGTGPNTFINNVASALTGTLAVGFLDSTNTTPPTVYLGYNTTRGTVTTKTSFSGQVSCMAGMFNSGSGAPSTTPRVLGEDYLDSTNGKWYRAKGVASSADWVALN